MHGDSPNSPIRWSIALSPQEAADLLGVPLAEFMEHILPGLRMMGYGSRRLVPVVEILRWLDECSDTDQRWLSKRREHSIVERHQKRCATKDGGACDCFPSYDARIRDPHSGSTHQKRFGTLEAARAWRAAAVASLAMRRKRTES
jgi:hypothetical protein